MRASRPSSPTDPPDTRDHDAFGPVGPPPGQKRFYDKSRITDEVKRGRKRSFYARGKETEDRARHELVDAGYSVIRASSSKGLVDLVASKPGHLRFISCKRAETLARGKIARTRETRDLKKHAYPLLNVGRHDAVTISLELWVWVDRQGWLVKETIDAPLLHAGDLGPGP